MNENRDQQLRESLRFQFEMVLPEEQAAAAVEQALSDPELVAAFHLVAERTLAIARRFGLPPSDAIT